MAICLPSVRESGGAVLLEAMAVGRPSVAVEYGGPAELIDDAIGGLLPATGREAVVNALTERFRDVSRRPGLWRERGVEARRRAEALYGWESKIDQAIAIYRRVREAAHDDH